MKAIVGGFIVLVAMTLSAQVRAQGVKEINAQPQATSGKTEVAKEGFAKVEEDKEKEKEKREATELQFAAGGLFSSGNAKAVSATGSLKGRLRREAHQGSMQLAANYAASPQKNADGTQGRFSETVRNLQGFLRYDYYVSDRVTLFLQASGRHDKFQYLDFRLNADPGVSYFFVQEKVRRLWGEAGFDYQLDLRNDDFVNANNADPKNEKLDSTSSRANGRAFIGFDEKTSKEVNFYAGVEYLQGFSQTDWFRISTDLGLKSQLSDKFSLSTTFTVRYESKPLPTVQHTDVLTAVSLVYSVL